MNIVELLEARYGASLYHGTDVPNAKRILQMDTLSAHTTHNTPFQKEIIRGTSLTRNPKVAKMFGSGVIFEFDQEKLSRRYKIVTYDFWHKTTSKYNQGQTFEAEEFVVGDVKPVSKYIKRIWVNKFILKSYPDDDMIENFLDYIKYNPKVVFGVPTPHEIRQFRLTEGRDAPLYHGTFYHNMASILTDNKIKAKTYHVYYDKIKNNNYAGEYGVSLTRNPEMAMRYASPGCIIELDQAKLSRDFKIKPHNYFRSPHQRHEAEEFVIGDIFPLDKYLVRIWVDPELENKKRFKELLDQQPILKNHPLLTYGYPLRNKSPLIEAPEWDLGGFWITDEGERFDVDHKHGLHHADIALDHFGEHLADENGEFDDYASDTALDAALYDGWIRVSTSTKILNMSWLRPTTNAIKALYKYLDNIDKIYNSYEIEDRYGYKEFSNQEEMYSYIKRNIRK